MSSRLSTRDRLGLLAISTAAVLTLWAGGNELTKAPAKAPVTTEAPPTLQGSAKAPRIIATELQEHRCHENTYRGDGPADGICQTMPAEIHEDDPWGRWDCATMGNRVCGGRYLALTG